MNLEHLLRNQEKLHRSLPKILKFIFKCVYIRTGVWDAREMIKIWDRLVRN